MHTYTQNRKCMNCNKPIADKEHGLQKFCPKEKLPNGTIKNCKDEYWSKIRKEEMEPFNVIAFFQRDQFKRLEMLIKEKGDLVTIEDINRFGVDLSRPVKFILKQDRTYEFYFHKYVVHQLPNNQFKIYTHELY